MDGVMSERLSNLLSSSSGDDRRIVWLLCNLLGQSVEVSVKSKDTPITGVLSDVDVEEGNGVSIKLRCATARTSLSGVVDRVDALNISGEDLVSVVTRNVSVLQSAHSGQVSDGFSDVDISGKKKKHFRELEKWQPEGEADEKLSLEGSEKWDQFAVNKEKFGVTSSYDVELYTTSLNRNADGYEEKKKEAEKIARRISSSKETNVHVLEERGVHVENNLDEEDRYGAVLRDDVKENGVEKVELDTVEETNEDVMAKKNEGVKKFDVNAKEFHISLPRNFNVDAAEFRPSQPQRVEAGHVDTPYPTAPVQFRFPPNAVMRGSWWTQLDPRLKGDITIADIYAEQMGKQLKEGPEEVIESPMWPFGNRRSFMDPDGPQIPMNKHFDPQGGQGMVGMQFPRVGMPGMVSPHSRIPMSAVHYMPGGTPPQPRSPQLMGMPPRSGYQQPPPAQWQLYRMVPTSRGSQIQSPENVAGQPQELLFTDMNGAPPQVVPPQKEQVSEER